MDNLNDISYKDYTIEKRGIINEDITIYSAIRNVEMVFTRDFTRDIYLTLDNGDIIGSFGINGEGLNNQFDSGVTNDMNIFIEDEFKSKGYSKIMMKHMIDKIFEDIPDINRDQMLFIDTDASNGFWDKVGLIESRYAYRIPKYTIEGSGFEKYITINNLYKFTI